MDGQQLVIRFPLVASICRDSVVSHRSDELCNDDRIQVEFLFLLALFFHLTKEFYAASF
jgi:hypothetical protein